MKNYIKNFKGFIAESIETNTKEVQLLDQKKALQEKLKQTTDDIQKTQIESDISKLDIEIEKIRQIEKQEEANEA
tara:strand:+ start:19391 stop:19615 length:225 start_codon:yes stop_codon:yes gene_type:complete